MDLLTVGGREDGTARIGRTRAGSPLTVRNRRSSACNRECRLAGSLVPALPPPAAEDARPVQRPGPRRAGRDLARPLRRAAHRGAQRRRPLLRARLLPRPGPALAARVLPPRRRRAAVRVRGRGRPPGRPADAHARHAPRRRARAGDCCQRATWRCSSAYARGRQRRRSRRRRALPIEFQLLRLEPEPWTIGRPARVRKLIALRALHQLGDASCCAPSSSREVGAERAARLEPQYPRGNPIVDGARASPARATARPREQIASVREALGSALRAGRLEQLGRLGRALGDGQAAARLRPAPDHHDPGPLVRGRPRLRRPGLRGATMPALPRIVIGQTAHVAWGFTNVMADTQDLFVERSARRRRPAVRVRGRVARAEIVPRGDHRQGPLATETLDVRDHPPRPDRERRARRRAGEPLALSWTGLQTRCSPSTGYDAARARERRGARRGRRELTRPAAQHALGRLAREHRLPARRASSRSAAATARTCRSRAGPASSSGRARSPTTSCPSS